MKQLINCVSYNDLVINTEKTTVMIFQGSKSRSIIRTGTQFRKKELNYLAILKLLGIYITENLKCYNHILYLCYNLSEVFYMIKSSQDTAHTFQATHISHNFSQH
jgi:hypothetical protein